MSQVSLDSGILYYRAGKEESKRQWIEDTARQQQIVSSVYEDAPGGCHFGGAKTSEKVLHRYFRYGIGEDVDAYVKTCNIRQKYSFVHATCSLASKKPTPRDVQDSHQFL
jgi:hypothetical protein